MSQFGVQGDPVAVPSVAPPRDRPVGAAERLGPAPIAPPPTPAAPAGPREGSMRYAEDGSVERFAANGEWAPFVAPEHADLLRAIGSLESQAESTLRNGKYAEGFVDGMLAGADALRKALGAPR